MAVRRLREGDADLIAGVKRMKSLPSFSSVVREAVLARSLTSLCNMIEPVLRKVVQDELQQGLVHCVGSLQRPSQLLIEEVEPPSNLQLVFTAAVPPQIYTKGKIEDEDDKPLQVKLIDTRTGEITPVNISPQSPIKLEIVVLNGDFPPRDCEDWSSDDFNGSIVKERNGREPLLVGESTVALRQGMASFEQLEFTDNSSWGRTGKFRLGVRISDPGSFQGPRIKEAVSKPFKVLDRRGEAYKKHFPPLPDDKVWRLKAIAKDGVFHQRLESENIRTVKDFLRRLNFDPNSLRDILGKGMSNKMWKAATKHAMTCSLVEEQYSCPGQPLTLGNRSSTLDQDQLLPQQMMKTNSRQIVEIKANGGNFVMQEVNSMTQGGMETWPHNYQQNIIIMPTYREVDIGTSMNNLQSDYGTILIPNTEFGLCNPFQRD